MLGRYLAAHQGHRARPRRTVLEIYPAGGARHPAFPFPALPRLAGLVHPRAPARLWAGRAVPARLRLARRRDRATLSTTARARAPATDIDRAAGAGAAEDIDVVTKYDGTEVVPPSRGVQGWPCVPRDRFVRFGRGVAAVCGYLR